MIADTLDAEANYTYFCRFMEHMVKVDPRVTLPVDQSVFLFAKDKTQWMDCEFSQEYLTTLLSRGARTIVDNKTAVHFEVDEYDEVFCCIIGKCACAICLFDRNDVHVSKSFRVTIKLKDPFVFFHSEDKWKTLKPLTNREIFGQDAIKDIIAGLQQLHYIANRSYVVVEPARKTKKHVPGCLPRIDMMDRHIIFDPEQMQKVYERREHQGGSHRSPIPHLRRGHTRTLKHERYGDNRGKTIHVPDMLVGVNPDEDIKIGKKIYHIVSIPSETMI